MRESKRMCKTIKQKVKFKAPPLTIYRLLADSKQHSLVTGARASLSSREGGRFHTQNGRVSGINVQLVPGKRLVQAWRAQDFPDGVFSMATFDLKPTPDGGTELVLTHRGVPKDLIPRTEENWRERYWARMKTFLATKA